MGLGLFFGVTGDVSSNDYNYPDAPWNQLEPEYISCPYCNGDGGIYFNDAGDEISVSDYKRLSEEEQKQWDFAKCEHCDGDGYIAYE